MRRHILLAGVLFLGLALTGRVRADDDKPLKVPFDTLKTQHIVVMVKINDKGPYRLIFDTGAPVTLINNKIAKDSGAIAKENLVPGIPPQYKLKTIEIGEVKAENLQTVVMDHPTVAAIDKVLGPVEGIIGLSFFGKYRITIDYKAKEMTFVPVSYRPPDVMKGMLSILSTPKKKVLAPAAQWGFSVTKADKDEEAGVDVKTVLAESPAAKAGLKVGDRLLTLDGRWTDSVADCYLAASFVRPGTDGRLLVLRDGKELELTVRVQAGL
jgi:hypothetical protein